MVGSLSAGLLLADEAGAHLPSVDDFLPPEILFQGTPFAINRIILIRIVATIVLLVVLGVTAKRAKLIPGRWQGVVEYGLDFVRDKVVYDVMGEARGKRYVPMITTLFFTIFIFNLCGIIPGMNMAANATVVMPLVFAVWTLIQYWIAAIRSLGEKTSDMPRIGVSVTETSTIIRFMECGGAGHIALPLADGERLASCLHDMADGCWRAHCGYVPEAAK